MSYFGSTEWYTEVSKGNVPGHSLVHKFGAGSVSSTIAPVSQTNDYQTPTTAQALEFVSASANDTAAGTGAREITVQGLDSSWNEVTIVIATNGLTAVPLGTNLIRMYRWFVSASGTYATSLVGSHAAALTIQASGGGTVWDTIPITPFPAGQSQIGANTVPTGFTGYLLGKLIVTDSSKVADVYFFSRTHADVVVAPFTGIMRVKEREVGITGSFEHHFSSPKGGFIGPCDVGFLAKVTSGSADISVEYEMLLIQDGF